MKSGSSLLTVRCSSCAACRRSPRVGRTIGAIGAFAGSMTGIRCTRALWAASAALALWLVVSVGAARSGVWINVSPSLPLGVYRVVAGPPERGAIVLVCLSAAVGRLARARGYLGPGPCPGGAGRLGKTVAAGAGDTGDGETTGGPTNGRA